MPKPVQQRRVRSVRLSDLVSALSYALDLTEGQPVGHAQRSCVLGIRLGQAMGLPEDELADLYYALLLKDSGCSSNAARMVQILGSDEISSRQDLKLIDWRSVDWSTLVHSLRHVRVGRPTWERLLALSQRAWKRHRRPKEVAAIRGERGASIALKMGFPRRTAEAIGNLDERWDGSGNPLGLEGDRIPIAARIVSLAQTLELFHRHSGMPAALRVARARSGRWFDPELVRAAHAIAQLDSLDNELAYASQTVARLSPAEGNVAAGGDRVDVICEAFAEVVDAKSPYTSEHSRRVTQTAVGTASQMGASKATLTLIRRAALLHDLGKLSVPNSILEKPTELTSEEWSVVKRHPYHSEAILKRIEGFEEIAIVAGAHHERLDGGGYFRGSAADQLSMATRILSVADVFDALAGRRPYRAAVPRDEVFSIMRREAPHALDGDCIDALVASQRALHAVQAPDGRQLLQSRLGSRGAPHSGLS
ncbi:HD domain-containing phosphohydrolase [uncultured Paludibaculum sp.]|uniref:HD-GYP domain-containing protein n=1 Tax=uncultured Paludibaculum sp. TaxID=1765020 RepID=UPI002AAAE673|nr:HD domain-containing phosphohydrolase [uncultured Paludibaculum sp.]